MFPGISTYSISLFWFGLEKFEKTFVIIVSLSLFVSVAWWLPFCSFLIIFFGFVGFGFGFDGFSAVCLGSGTRSSGGNGRGTGSTRSAPKSIGVELCPPSICILLFGSVFFHSLFPFSFDFGFLGL